MQLDGNQSSFKVFADRLRLSVDLFRGIYCMFKVQDAGAGLSIGSKQNFVLERQKLEEIDGLSYLGSCINSGQLPKEVSFLVQKAPLAFASLKNPLYLPDIRISIKK